MTFLDYTNSNILTNKYNEYLFAQVSEYIIIVSICANMPQNIFPMRNMLLKAWTGVDSQDIDTIPPIKIIIASLLCNLICLSFGIITDKIENIMTVLGDTINVFVCMIIPCI